MAATAAASSIMGNAQANENAYKSQLAINAGQKSANVNTRGEMQEQQREAGIGLTALAMEEQRQLAKVVASKANSNTAGASAAYAWINTSNQFNIKEGNLLVSRDSMVRDLGKTSQKLAINAQNNWNQAESKKKSGMAMMLEAAMAGAQGYAAGQGMQAAANDADGWGSLLGFGNN